MKAACGGELRMEGETRAMEGESLRMEGESLRMEGETRAIEGDAGFPVRSGLPSWMLKDGEAPENKKLKHRDSRRCFSHDYCSPGFYMITATTVPGAPPLSSMPDILPGELKKGEMIIPIHSELGNRIREEIQDIPAHHPEMKINRFVVMPDHIHVIIQVKERLKRMLGKELAGFFGACSKHWQSLSGSPTLRRLFNTFHDRVIFDYNQLDRAIKYVEDNPRRLIVKRIYKDLFKRYLHLEIAGREYAAYGNIFLLKEIYLLPVRVHRRWSREEFDDYRKHCEIEIFKGAVPITPAIHPAEKEIVNYAIETGGRVILLSDQGFEERFKPKGRNFDLCAEGRLLLLAPWPENVGRKSEAGYSEFHKMNDLAQTISSLPSSLRLLLKRE